MKTITYRLEFIYRKTIDNSLSSHIYVQVKKWYGWRYVKQRVRRERNMWFSERVAFHNPKEVQQWLIKNSKYNSNHILLKELYSSFVNNIDTI